MGGVKTKISKKDKQKIRKIVSKADSYKGKLMPISDTYYLFGWTEIASSNCLFTVGFKKKQSEGSILSDDLLNLLFSYDRSYRSAIPFLGLVGRVCQRWYVIRLKNAI